MVAPVDLHGKVTADPVRPVSARAKAKNAEDFNRSVTKARNEIDTGGTVGKRGRTFSSSGSNGPGAQDRVTNAGEGGSSAPPTRRDLETDPDGRLETTVQEGEDLPAFAERFGRTEEEIIAANPWLFPSSADPAAPRALNPGQTVVIYSDERAAAIVEIVNTDDAERRAALIRQQLSESVYGKGGDTPTPGDYLGSAKAELSALKLNDDAFRDEVSEQADDLTHTWQTMGLTHDVWDPLLAAAENEDWDTFDEILTDQLSALATTSPTVDEIEAYGELLKTYGPGGDFTRAVSRGIDDFLVDDPAAAAEEVAEIYDQGGLLNASEASTRLRQLTDPHTVDPLTAALIAKEAQPTIERLLDEIQFGEAYSAEIFHDLSQVASSAYRSPEGRNVLDFMLDTLLPAGEDAVFDLVMPAAELASADLAADPLLNLALANRLQSRGNIDQATAITQSVEQGARKREEDLIGTVDQLSETVLPLFEPLQWNGFINDPNSGFELPDLQQLSETWLDENPDIGDRVDDALEQINRQTYDLNRARNHLAAYAPNLDGVENQDALVELAHSDPLQDEDPHIIFAVTLSPASAVQDLRDANLAGMDAGTLTSLSQIALDPNWHMRMYPRTASAIAESRRREDPFPNSLGLSLYNGGFYSSGVYNQGSELMAKIDAHGFRNAIFNEGGWRNIASGFHYGWGAAISGTQLAKHLFDVAPGKDTIWGSLLNNTLLSRSFARYNVVGTATYALGGNYEAAGALGTATVGSVTNNFVVPGLKANTRLKIPRWVTPGANILLLIGTGLLVVNDVANRREIAARTEPFNEDYLIAAGVDSEVASALADNDEEGLSAASRLAALADYRGISQPDLLSYLNTLSPDEVEQLVHATHSVKPGENGEYPRLHFWEGRNFSADQHAADERGYFQPATLAALNGWVDTHLPGMPQTTAAPVAPPYLSTVTSPAEDQLWLNSPGGRAWRMRQDQEMLAEIEPPGRPVG